MNDQDGISEYDQSFSTFGRMNFNFWESEKAQREKNAHGQYDQLKNVASNVIAIISGRKDGGKKRELVHREFMKQIEESFKEYERILNLKRTVPGVQAKNLRLPRKVHDLLFEWEIQLKKDLVAEGILIKKKIDGTTGF